VKVLPQFKLFLELAVLTTTLSPGNAKAVRREAYTNAISCEPVSLRADGLRFSLVLYTCATFPLRACLVCAEWKAV